MKVIKTGARYARSGRRVARPDYIIWTPREIENAMVLYDDDHSFEDIAEALGRRVEAVTERIHIELRKRNNRGRGHSLKASTHQQAERDRRRAGYDARDFTSTFFGDPPRGFSALDKQRDGAAR